MKKIALLGATTIALLSLAACSSSKDTSTTKDDSKTAQQSSEKPKVDNSKFDSAISTLKEQIDPDGTAFSYEIKNDVITSDYPDGHTEIRVTPKDKAGTEDLKKMDEEASSGNTDQQLAISMFKQGVSDAAKKLPDDTTSITFGYEVAADQQNLLAASTKTKDIIPLD